MQKKQAIFLFIISLTISAAISAEQRPKGPPPGGPQLTAEQQTCLESKLGPKDSGNRPSREAMEAAFSSCGIEKPKGPPPGERGDRAPQSKEDAEE